MTVLSDGYAALVDRLLFPAWEGALARRPTLRYRALLEQTERAPLSELEALQTTKLMRLVQHATKNVPYYRARFRDAGLSAGDVRSLDDVEKLPILTRDEAQRTIGARTSEAPPRVAFRAFTGGTLGSALEFGYDADAEWWRKAAQLRAWGWAGYRIGSPVLYYVGDHHGLHVPPGARLRTVAERTLKQERYLSCMVRDEKSLRAAARHLCRVRPKIMVCYPQAAADLARHLSRYGPRTFTDVRVLCHGEKLFPADRRAMEKAFGFAVFETYVSRETFMIGSECEVHDGLHIAMENVLVEVLVKDGEGYRRAVNDEVGEVVLTDLNNLGMPFIRYAIGDVATAPRLEPCACGRTLPRISSVEGRAVETLRGPSGERISSTLFEQIIVNVLESELKQFQIVQRSGGDIVLRVVPLRVFAEGALERLRAECRGMVPGLTIAVTVVPALLPEPGGKRRVVVVESV